MFIKFFKNVCSSEKHTEISFASDTAAVNATLLGDEVGDNDIRKGDFVRGDRNSFRHYAGLMTKYREIMQINKRKTANFRNPFRRTAMYQCMRIVRY